MRTLHALLATVLVAATLPVVSGAPTDPVENTTTGVGYTTISAALAAAAGGDFIVVRPGTYAEGQLTLAVAGVTLCSAKAGSSDCDGSPTEVIIDGAGAIYPVFIAADFVTMTGFTIQNPTYGVTEEASPGADPSLVVVYGADDVYVTRNVLQQTAAPLVAGESRFATDAINIAEDQATGERPDRLTVQGNTIRDLPSSVGPDGTCSVPAPGTCRTSAIDAWGVGTGLFVEGNDITVPPSTPGAPPQSVGIWGGQGNHDIKVQNNAIRAGATPTGAYGVKGTFGDSLFELNTFTGFQHGIFVAGADVTVDRNTFSQSNEGLRITSRGATISGNAFQANNIGVQVAAPNGAPEAHDLVFRDNVFDGNRVNLAVHAQVSDTYVDARYNDWGVYSSDLIAAFIADSGTGNTVDFTCFLDADGTTEVCPPEAGFTWSPLRPVWGANVPFTDTSVGHGRAIEAWAWDFAGLGTSDLQAPTFRFPRGGWYDVTLTVTDEEGFTDSVTRTVEVSGEPLLSRIGPKSTEVGRLLRFSVNAQAGDANPLTYSATGLPAGASFAPANRTFWWVPGEGDAGVHTGVRFSVSNGTASDHEDVTITVRSNPAVAVSVSGATSAEASPGESVAFTFKVKNNGLAENTFDLTPATRPGWTIASSASSVTLAKGAETSVTVTVVPDASVFEGTVSLEARSLDGARGVASASVVLPLTVEVAMDFPTYFLQTDVTGTVSVTWKDGSAAVGLPIDLVEASSVGGLLLPGERTLALTSGAGPVAFAFEADPTGSTLVGEHTVTATVGDATATATYQVL